MGFVVISTYHDYIESLSHYNLRVLQTILGSIVGILNVSLSHDLV